MQLSAFRATAIAAASLWFLSDGFIEIPSARAEPPTYTTGINAAYVAGVPRPYTTDELEALASQLRPVQFEMTSCGPNARSVRAHISQTFDADSFGDAARRDAFDEILREATVYAWSACPLATHVSGDPYTVDSAVIQMPDGQNIAEADHLINTKISFFNDMTFAPYRWEVVRSEKDASVLRTLRLVGIAVLLSPLAFLLRLIWSSRRSIGTGIAAGIRWYYFNLHPHPAEPLVRRAIETDRPLDGPSLARALQEVPPGNRFLREARLAQATRLFAQLETATMVRIRQLERTARDEYQRAAIIASQEALALAAVALERARAAFKASQSVQWRT